MISHGVEGIASKVEAEKEATNQPELVHLPVKNTSSRERTELDSSRPLKVLEDVEPEHQHGPQKIHWTEEISGGEFGLAADWRKAIVTPGSANGIRGDKCRGQEEQEKVRMILERRNRTPPTQRVCSCRDQPRFPCFTRNIGGAGVLLFSISPFEFHLSIDRSYFPLSTRR